MFSVRRISPLTIAFSLFFLLAAVSSLWALNPADALKRGTLGLLAVLSAHVLIRWIRANATLIIRENRWYMSGAATGLMFITFEVATHQTISKFIVVHLFHRELGFWGLNLNLTSAILMLWPLLMLLRSQTSERAYMAMTLCLLAVMAFSTFASEHETSKLAFVVATLAFGLSSLWPSIMSKALRVGWLIPLLLIAPLSIIAHDLFKSQTDEWLQESAKHRLVIWNNVAKRVPDAPILGHGTRSLYQLNLDEKARGRGHNVLGYDAIPPNAHNIYLQTWYELGAIGVLIAAAGGLLILRSINDMPPRIFSLTIAAASTGMVQMLSNFELWQIWYLSSLALTVVLVSMARTAFSKPSEL